MRQSLKFKKLKTLSRTYLVLIIDIIIFNKDFMIIIKMNVFFSAVVLLLLPIPPSHNNTMIN